MNLLILFIAAIALSLFSLLAFRYIYRKLGAKVEPQLKEVLGERLDEESGYSFYTAGHPYYWVKVERGELLAQLYRYFVGLHGLSPQVRKEILIDDENKSIYIGIINGGAVVPVNKLNLKHYNG